MEWEELRNRWSQLGLDRSTLWSDIQLVGKPPCCINTVKGGGKTRVYAEQRSIKKKSRVAFFFFSRAPVFARSPDIMIFP